jgi:hypothetical protein
MKEEKKHFSACELTSENQENANSKSNVASSKVEPRKIIKTSKVDGGKKAEEDEGRKSESRAHSISSTIVFSFLLLSSLCCFSDR